VRLLGKKPAVKDHRVKMLSDRLTIKLPAAPDRVNWYAMTPRTGVPMLLNDKLGCCVAATACHYVQQSSLYTAQHTPLTPTDAECLAMYTNSGYVPGNVATDQGWTVLGHGGLIEAWTKGFVIGGKVNKVGPVASVNFKDSEELRVAISLFGYVLAGASLSESNVDSNFLWELDATPIVGMHEFILCGCEKIGTSFFYDVLTWNGLWRASEAWVQQRLDEALVIYDEVFFNVRGVSGAGIDRATLHADLAGFHGTSSAI
jgi:hypothetical protein